MGEVWLAEQAEPIRRKVALKLIKAGMDTRQVIARFEAERQALALMDHPTIAKVFDAGETPHGLPYFAMEYVQGETIGAYCDRHRLTTAERLELFVQVCEGIQHAHQKGIIHRDLKPSNVLVTVQGGKPVPKIIDFGVAKATAQKLTERTMYTELGVLIGTPEYMSPEQAEMTGLDVDTRTDVYAAGVILYELLTGALPFDPKELRTAGFDEIRRRIREVDPPRPSTKVSSLGDRAAEFASRRHTEPGKLVGRLKGDLDWIVMKALEKDRTRRYASPSELAADIRRHLNDQPVLASPPSVVYRTGKFIRRHRLGVTAAAAVIVALVAAVVGTTVGLLQARRAESTARGAQARAERVAAFLSAMLGDMDPIGMGKTVRAEILDQVATQRKRRTSEQIGSESSISLLEGVNTVDISRHLVDGEILRKAVERIETELRDDPALAARLYHTIGLAENSLQLYERNREILTRAIEVSTLAYGAEDELTLDLQDDLAHANMRGGRYSEAESIERQVVATARRSLGEEARQTLVAMNHLGDTYRYEGRPLEAEPLLRDTVQKMRRALGESDWDTLDACNNWALALRDERRYAEAVTLLSETVEKAKRIATDGDRLITIEGNLAVMLRLSGRLEEAERLLLDLREAGRRSVGEDVYITLLTTRNLGDVYVAQGRTEEAEALARENIARMRRVLGQEHPETLTQQHVLAVLLTGQGQFAEAEPMLLEVIQGFKQSYGERNFKTLRATDDLGSLYERQGRRAEAERLFLGTAQALESEHPIPLDAVYAEAAFHLACLAAARGEFPTARKWLEASVDAGFSTPERITANPDLVRMQGPEIDRLVQRARAH